MKKLVLFFIGVSFFLCIKVEASNWRFEWDAKTTTIEIPLGDTLQNYLTIPKAILYKNDDAMLDAEIHYITTGDWLYLLTDVDTTRVGNYQVWYKAVESRYQPGQCQGYKTLVTFQVVDKEKPIIKEIPSTIKYFIGAEKPIYENQIIVTDNSGNCKLTIDDSQVNYESPGIYDVFARVSDGYNMVEEKIEVVVEDPIGPIVTFLGDNNKIILLKDEKPNLKQFFKAIDKIDGDVTGSIEYDAFATDIERTFMLEVSFYDSSYNKSSFIVEVEIVDKNEPSIELKQSLLILDYTENFEEALQLNLKHAYLGKEDISSEIEIQSNINKNTVGSYMATYVYNKNGKYKEQTCEIKLLSKVPPILLIKNAKVKINEKISIFDYITIQDPSDADILAKLSYDDSNVDYSKAGTYYIPISVINSSGLTTTETMQVTVYASDLELPNQSIFKYVFIILIGGISSGIGIFIFIRKKRNCNKEQNTL